MTEKYQVIYADPPWSYRNKKTGRDMKHGAAQKYSTMTMQEILSLPVSEISDRDSALFLWATTPLLREAFEVMDAWGFKYKTAIYWRKIMSLGMGYWFRGQVEVCLLGVRGRVKAFHLQRANFIQSKARKHSQKPDEMYDLIEQTGLNPKIELFAREKRPGWDSWGNEIESDIQFI